MCKKKKMYESREKKLNLWNIIVKKKYFVLNCTSFYTNIINVCHHFYLYMSKSMKNNLL